MLPEELPLGERERARGWRSCGPAMALKCRPLRIEPLPAGTPVGYGGQWAAPRESLVATLPVGYGDGWPRSSTPGT